MAAGAGVAIRDERLRRRWSLAVLADRAGISPAHLAQLEAGKAASLETYARVMVALDRRPELLAVDPRQRTALRRGDEDLVHAAMGELEAAHLAGLGYEVAMDEPYQHYQFAGRADVAAWDRTTRALLHIENRTRFPNVQEALGSYGAKRAYLGRALAERLEIPGGWVSETHVMVALWSSEVIHVIRQREASFGASCPDRPDGLRAWWAGDVAGLRGITSSLALLDPTPGVRNAYRFTDHHQRTRPRYRGYADAADALRER